jgi:hypothetical protein
VEEEKVKCTYSIDLQNKKEKRGEAFPKIVFEDNFLYMLLISSSFHRLQGKPSPYEDHLTLLEFLVKSWMNKKRQKMSFCG